MEISKAAQGIKIEINQVEVVYAVSNNSKEFWMKGKVKDILALNKKFINRRASIYSIKAGQQDTRRRKI